MHKYMITALFALVFAVPGMANTTATYSISEASLCVKAQAENAGIDPQLVKAILHAAAGKCSYSYAELSQGYEDGVVTIDKVPEYYRVTVGGGAAIILIEEVLF
jgi:hypothetical protein